MVGRRTSVTDPLQNVTYHDYGNDGKHLLYHITDPLNHVTHFTYHSVRHLTVVEDPNGNTTTYVYNTNGTLHSVACARPRLWAVPPLAASAQGAAPGTPVSCAFSTATARDGPSTLRGRRELRGTRFDHPESGAICGQAL